MTLMTKPLPSLTIFFPVYRDESTVEPLTLASLKVGRDLTDDLEVLIIDDAGPDRAGAIADRLASEHPEVRVIHHERNRGYGQALMSGWRGATKAYVFYTDGDMQFDVAELPKLVEHAANHELVAGYRLSRAEGWSRALLSRVHHVLLLVLFGARFRDTDCSFKLISRGLLERIRFKTSGALVDAELLLQARALGARIREVGVHHYRRPFGSSTCLNPRLITQTLRDYLDLRLKLRA